MNPYIQKSIEQISDLSNFIKKKCHDNTDIITHCLTLNTALRTNPRMVLNELIESIEVHAQHILEENDDYFLNSDKSELGITNEYHDFANSMKTLWINLDDNDKSLLRKKMKALLILGTMSTQNVKLRDLINKYRSPTNQLNW